MSTLTLDTSQTEAVKRCIDISQDNRIVPITGEAGTGKTTILENVYRHLEDQGIQVVICAPTGKAAKRVKEATGIDAMTIHRLLEYPHPGEMNPKTGKPLVTTDPKRDKFNPIEYTVVLADEYAMVNYEVHRNLVDALPPGGCLRMFGDANQLQPIEKYTKGTVESQFVKALRKYNGIRLQTIHRQDEGSIIIRNGSRIVNGSMPTRDDLFQLKIVSEPIQAIEDFVMDSVHEDRDFTSIDYQMITPNRVGWVGTDALNVLIQGLVVPSDQFFLEPERHPWSKTTGLRFYKDDKVIQTTNQYDLDIFNGETGRIIELHDDGTITIDFGDKIRGIPPVLTVDSKRGRTDINPQKDLDLAYCITTHKSQGSEYDEVCYIINSSRPFLLNRKNFYTAISRAKKRVTVITDQRSLSLSLYKRGD
jgi:exodeoxyribonuclease V alpha subunit